MVLFVLLACATETNSPADTRLSTLTTPSASPTVPTPTTPAPTTPTTPVAETWTLAVWMDGDNDLEKYVMPDLDELERAVGPNVRVVVQADRIPGYDDSGGDWVGTRRYEMLADAEPGVISPLLEDLGEVDMGSEVALAEFLLWANATAPADHFVLSLWNHGGGFWIASDDTDGGKIDLAGELQAGLQPLVDARGKPLDVVAFDACNMGEWEAAQALRGLTLAMTASQAWVGGKGLEYDLALAGLPADADAFAVADLLAWSAGEMANELTYAAIDVERIQPLSDAIDGLAGAYLAHPDGVRQFQLARESARGLDREWEEWWLDLGSFADEAALNADPAIAAAGELVRSELGAVVVGNYARDQVAFAAGLTIYTDTSYEPWVDSYQGGPWAETRWAELLDAVRDAEK